MSIEKYLTDGCLGKFARLAASIIALALLIAASVYSCVTEELDYPEPPVNEKEIKIS
jgi:hypothetical protein